ncbi:MAG: threonine synthase [Campylobacterales bacterium]
MRFIETRGNDGIKPTTVTFSQALLSPSASFGGLYVPEELPKLPSNFLANHLHSTYKELATALLELFEIDISADLIAQALARYDHFDNPADPVPVVKVAEDLYVSELWHGPTRAFKDMALQPFGIILSALAQHQQQEYLILAATSGDTGPAALETFKNRPNTRIVCLYPDGGTSDVQRLQMVTQNGANQMVLGIHGNFDDAQSALKKLLSSPSFNDRLAKANIKLSAANSVNFGRIIFQTIYHISSYLALVRQGATSLGEPVYLIVPSGNFGNALGGYYAKKMGLPVTKILIASNANNILTELIEEGRYDLRGRTLIPTLSPAMDILISSNVERILFDKFGSARTKELMEQLAHERLFELSRDEAEAMRQEFAAAFTDDEQIKSVIRRFAAQGYLMDPHTATGIACFEHKRTTKAPAILYSTAEWTKFSPTLSEALGMGHLRDQEALAAIATKFGVTIPAPIAALFSQPTIHSTIISPARIEEEVLAFLKI